MWPDKQSLWLCLWDDREPTQGLESAPRLHVIPGARPGRGFPGEEFQS